MIGSDFPTGCAQSLHLPGLQRAFQAVVLGKTSWDAAGKYARELEALSDSQQADRAMAVLRKIVGSKLAEPDAVLVSRWSQEKFTGGSYSYIPVGSTLNDYDVLARPMGRLLFAGEATDRELFASVNGAYVSGLREADRAAKLFS